MAKEEYTVQHSGSVLPVIYTLSSLVQPSVQSFYKDVLQSQKAILVVISPILTYKYWCSRVYDLGCGNKWLQFPSKSYCSPEPLETWRDTHILFWIRPTAYMPSWKAIRFIRVSCSSLCIPAVNNITKTSLVSNKQVLQGLHT